MKLEEKLDRQVSEYLKIIEDMQEVKDFLSGKISKENYIKFLKTFYLIEFLSQRAVNMASINTEVSNPYLSKRFKSCAQGELGHAEVALRDLKDLGVDEVDHNESSVVKKYNDFLSDAAEKFPLQILGHSYLFENVSGILFNKNKPLNNYPSKFIEIHAKEDPGHSLAIKRTVRKIEDTLDETQIDDIVEFSKTSGEFLMEVFNNLN